MLSSAAETGRHGTRGRPSDGRTDRLALCSQPAWWSPQARSAARTVKSRDRPSTTTCAPSSTLMAGPGMSLRPRAPTGCDWPTSLDTRPAKASVCLCAQGRVPPPDRRVIDRLTDEVGPGGRSVEQRRRSLVGFTYSRTEVYVATNLVCISADPLAPAECRRYCAKAAKSTPVTPLTDRPESPAAQLALHKPTSETGR